MLNGIGTFILFRHTYNFLNHNKRLKFFFDIDF